MSYHDHGGWHVDRVSASPVVRRPALGIWRDGGALAILVVAALVLRFGQFGNPLAGLDEQFYLLVGDRMWHGELPYVDLWDRKPFGLFLLFAAIRALPGDGVLAAQLVATGFAAATAWCAMQIARRTVRAGPALLAGIFYLAGLTALWGETTQTPVFYNLFVIIAAWLTLYAGDGQWNAARRRAAFVAMALVGVAIQIKTNALFQGVVFGGWTLWTVWRRTRDGTRCLLLATVFAALGALPTLGTMAFFAARGQFGVWWQANVLSILAKGGGNDAAAMNSLVESIILTSPIIVFIVIGLRCRTEKWTRWTAETVLIMLWMAAGFVDFAAIGGYYPHYALPLLLAAIPIAAHAFAMPKWGKWLAVVALVGPATGAVVGQPRVGARERSHAALVVAALPADVRTRCLFIYEGPVAYYGLTQACRVSRFAFTAHISSIREAPSLGVDPGVALDAAMARRPGTVMTLAHSTSPTRNLAMEARLSAWLRPGYHVIAVLPHKEYAPDERLLIWRRNDLAG